MTSKALPIVKAPCTLPTTGPSSRGVRQILPARQHLFLPAVLPGKPPATCLPGNLLPRLKPLFLTPRLRSQFPIQRPKPRLPESPRRLPSGPVPADPQTGSRVTHPEGSGGVMQVADRSGKKRGRERSARGSHRPLQRVSWSPPQPEISSSDGKIVIRRDRQGVIHITRSVKLDEVPLIAPATPTPAVQQQARAPALILPAVHEVSCPEFGTGGCGLPYSQASKSLPRLGLAKPFTASRTAKASGISSTNRLRTCSYPRLR